MSQTEQSQAAKRPVSWANRILSPPLAILSLALVALRPILQRDLPCTDDAAFHLLRLTQLDHLLGQGVWFSRLAPDMAQGYGFLLFNFYAPLSYYAAELVALFAGNLHLSLRLTFALGLFLSGLSLYALANQHMGRWASLVAAVAYMYAPYQAYDILFRGNLAESFAWWLLPLSLWCMHRMIHNVNQRHHARWIAATALSYAAVLLTHNVFALIFSPLLAAYALWQAAVVQKPTGRTLMATAGSILLGLALAVFFWLPALIERDLIHTERLLVPPIFVYWGNFVTLSEIFSLPYTVRLDLINPSPPRALGLVQLLIASLSLFAYLRAKTSVQSKRQITFLWLMLIGMVFIMTDASRVVWDVVPLLEFVQFPWRWLGPAALVLALLCGYGVQTLIDITSRRTAPWFSIGFGTAMIMSTLFWITPTYCPGLYDPTVADILNFERNTATIGTTAKGEYLPLTVDYMPEQPYVQPFTAENQELLTIVNQARTPRRLTAEITATDNTTLIGNTFFYPGWRATLNGESIPLAPIEGSGLIVMDIPAGQYTVDLFFGETPLRRTGNWISILAVGLTTVLFLWPTNTKSAARVTIANEPPPNMLAPIVIGLVLLAAVNYLPAVNSRIYRTGPTLRPAYDPSAAVQAIYQGDFALQDFQIVSRATTLTDGVTVWLEWTALAPQNRELQATIRLRHRDGSYWSAKDSAPPRIHRPAYGTQFWQPGQFAQDAHVIMPLPGTPPAQYTLELTLFDKATLAPIPLVNGATAVDLGTVVLSRPAAPPPQPQFLVNAEFDGLSGQMTLLGYNLDRSEARPGDPFLMTTFLRQNWETSDNYLLHINLLDPNGQQVAHFERQPVLSEWPTSNWENGDIWRGQHALRLPAALESGMHQWQLCLVETSQSQSSGCLNTGMVSINAPDRALTQPQLAAPIGHILDNNVSLNGLAQPLPATLAKQTLPPQLKVDLVWSLTTAEVETSYRIFVHILDENGQLIAQSDAEPAQWQRPTTGWIVDEYIFDSHLIALPAADQIAAGQYQIVAGLYDPLTGQRLLSAERESFVVVGTIQIDDN